MTEKVYNYSNADEQQDREAPQKEGLKMTNPDKYLDTPYDVETTEEESETDAEKLGLSPRELNILLPQLFTRNGTIRRDTRFSLRGFEQMIFQVKMGERARNEYMDMELPGITVELPCGHVRLSDDLCAHIFLNDLFVAIATKGWNIKAG